MWPNLSKIYKNRLKSITIEELKAAKDQQHLDKDSFKKLIKKHCSNDIKLRKVEEEYLEELVKRRVPVEIPESESIAKLLKTKFGSNDSDTSDSRSKLPPIKLRDTPYKSDQDSSPSNAKLSTLNNRNFEIPDTYFENFAKYKKNSPRQLSPDFLEESKSGNLAKYKKHSPRQLNPIQESKSGNLEGYKKFSPRQRDFPQESQHPRSSAIYEVSNKTPEPRASLRKNSRSNRDFQTANKTPEPQRLSQDPKKSHSPKYRLKRDSINPPESRVTRIQEAELKNSSQKVSNRIASEKKIRKHYLIKQQLVKNEASYNTLKETSKKLFKKVQVDKSSKFERMKEYYRSRIKPDFRPRQDLNKALESEKNKLLSKSFNKIYRVKISELIKDQ